MTNFLSVDQQTCSILEEKTCHNKYCAKSYLDKMKVYLPKLEISGWQHNGIKHENTFDNFDDSNYCRQIINLVLMHRLLSQYRDNIYLCYMYNLYSCLLRHTQSLLLVGKTGWLAMPHRH